MRSDLVFLAGSHIPNRFLLCHWVRVASRRFHKNGEPIQETISKVLALVTQQNSPDPGGSQIVREEFLDAAALRQTSRNSPGSVARLSEEPIRNVG